MGRTQCTQHQGAGTEDMRWNTGVKHGLQGVLVDLAALHDDPQMGIGVAQEVQIAIWVAIDHEQVSPCAGAMRPSTPG